VYLGRSEREGTADQKVRLHKGGGGEWGKGTYIIKPTTKATAFENFPATIRGGEGEENGGCITQNKSDWYVRVIGTGNISSNATTIHEGETRKRFWKNLSWRIHIARELELGEGQEQAGQQNNLRRGEKKHAGVVLLLGLFVRNCTESEKILPI